MHLNANLYIHYLFVKEEEEEEKGFRSFPVSVVHEINLRNLGSIIHGTLSFVHEAVLKQ